MDDKKFKSIVASQKRLIKALILIHEKAINISQALSDPLLLEVQSMGKEFSAAQKNLYEYCEDNSSHLNEVEEIQGQFDSMYFEVLALQSQPPETKPVIAPSTFKWPIQLPSLAIPKFDGNWGKWNNFFSLFEAIVDNQTDLTSVTKFQLLRAHCVGPALALIENLPISDGSYNTALDILKARYNDPRALANFHFSNIYNFSCKDNSPDSLKQFYSTFQSSITAITNLNIDTADFLFLELGLKSLPNELRLKFEQTIKSGMFPKMADLFEFINSIERSNDIVSGDNPKNDTPHHTPPRPTRKFIRGTTHPQMALVTRVTADKPMPTCSYCDIEGHQIFHCTDFLLLSIPERYEAVKRLKKCFSCMGNHARIFCKSDKVCGFCKSPRHNTLLHAHDASSPQPAPSSSGTTDNQQ